MHIQFRSFHAKSAYFSLGSHLGKAPYHNIIIEQKNDLVLSSTLLRARFRRYGTHGIYFILKVLIGTVRNVERVQTAQNW